MKIAVYNLCMQTLGGGERRTALLASHFAQRHEVTLFVDTPIDAGLIRKAFAIDVSPARIIPLAGTDHQQRISSTQPDIFINNSAGSDLPCPAPCGIYMCMFPFNSTIDLTSYSSITANSVYTARWIKRRWHYDSEVVYSACRQMGPPGTKEKIILNVGRFYRDDFFSHHKRQDVLVQAFVSMREAIEEGWQLHLVGNVARDGGGPEFVDQLREQAKGWPIRILTDLSFHELREEYRRASLYWHATGFGSSEEEQPQRQEHFGMTVLEAMSAGAVPFAYRSGGPCEFICSGLNGYLWADMNELIQHASELIGAPEKRRSMSTHACLLSKHFTETHFLDRMDSIVARLQRRLLGAA